MHARDLLTQITTEQDTGRLRQATQMLHKNMSQPQFVSELMQIMFSQDPLALLAIIQLKNNTERLQLSDQHKQTLIDFVPAIRE